MKRGYFCGTILDIGIVVTCGGSSAVIQMIDNDFIRPEPSKRQSEPTMADAVGRAANLPQRSSSS